METSLKGLTLGRVESGIMRGLGTFYHKVIALAPQNALPYEMVAHNLPYEASKTYRVMKSEFECKRSQALVEVARMHLHGF